MALFRRGSYVQWKWLGRPINGRVEAVYKEHVVHTIKGKRIKRNGSPDKPAYLVRSDAGNLALKLQTELTAYKKNQSAWRESSKL